MKPEIDLLNVGECCKRAALPYAQTLRAMNLDPNFPKPAVSQGNLKRWHGKDIDAWASKFREKNMM
jgi:predicted DNA-binding transcriptional regulator AlpA